MQTQELINVIVAEIKQLDVAIHKIGRRTKDLDVVARDLEKNSADLAKRLEAAETERLSFISTAARALKDYRALGY